MKVAKLNKSCRQFFKKMLKNGWKFKKNKQSFEKNHLLDKPTNFDQFFFTQ